MMADLIAGLLRRTGEAMATRRTYGGADERRVTAELPPPVLPVRKGQARVRVGLTPQPQSLATERTSPRTEHRCTLQLHAAGVTWVAASA